MNIGTEVTFITDLGIQTGTIIWVSLEFVWVDDGSGNVQKISLFKIQIQ